MGLSAREGHEVAGPVSVDCMRPVNILRACSVQGKPSQYEAFQEVAANIRPERSQQFLENA